MTRIFMVVGAQRTGSTLLATTLGMVPGAAVVGELRLLWPSLHEGRPCACLRSSTSCDVWSRVVSDVLDHPDVRGHSIADLARLNAESLRQRHLSTFLVGRMPPELEPLAAATTALYQALDREYRGAVLVDSSKSPAFYAFARLLARRDPSITLNAVHLVKDPRGVVESWSKDKIWKRDGWSEELRAKPVRQATQEWVTMNTGAELARVRPRLRFEDFTAQPEIELRRLVSLAGLRQPTAAELPIVDGAVIVRENHAVGGNVDRFDTGPVPLRPSEGWRSRLDLTVQRQLTPLARRYGYRP